MQFVERLEKRTLAWIAVLCVMALAISLTINAQTFVNAIDAFQAIRPQDFAPVSIPNMSTNVGLAKDFYYTDIRITNITAGSVTITILDRQGSPQALAQALPIPANTVIQFTCNHGCRLPGGFSWQAGAATSLVGYVRGYYN